MAILKADTSVPAHRGFRIREPESSEPLRVERRVSNRGALVIAGQRIQAGIHHAGQTLSIEAADTLFRVYDRDHLLTEVPRTTTKPIARFKARKPEPPRRVV